MTGIEPLAQGGADEPTGDKPARVAGAEGDTAQREASPAAGTTGKAAAPHPAGGIRRSQLTEIWGPPGVGKTAFGYVAMCSALSSPSRVDHGKADIACTGYNS